MTPSQFLRAFLMPGSVALVGASNKAGSMGRIAMENLLAGTYRGALYAVNPNHRRVLARRSYASLAAIGKPVELALIAVPFAAVPGVLDDAATAGVKAAVVLSAPPGEPDEARRWSRDLLRIAISRDIRLLGVHSFGLIRTDIGLNATIGNVDAHPGRLALVAHSGAVCSAMLDFAWAAGIGFSSVIALGSAIDVGFGELLDALLFDGGTDGILLYTEKIGAARRFLSALRAAARIKPVVVLKGGRSMERASADGPSPDAVFDAAMRRCGTVRVRTYTQLFAAARILAMTRMSRGDRLAIVTNGYGPGTLAADCACDVGIPLAEFSPATETALASVLPANVAVRNPINVRGDATPARFATAIDASLSDPQVDAVLTLHVTRPSTSPTDVARAVAAVARKATKPVLAAWMGSNRRESEAALEAGGVPNFYTPEIAVNAFAALAMYRHNQQWLLEVAPPQPEPHPPELTGIEQICAEAAAANRSVLTVTETQSVLQAFGLPVASSALANTLDEALTVARRIGYPVTLRPNIAHATIDWVTTIARERLRDGRMLQRAWAALPGGAAGYRAPGPVVVRHDRTMQASREVAIGVRTDAVFGPVITFGGASIAATHERSVLLPPLNERVARDFLIGVRKSARAREAREGNDIELLTQLLVQVSALVCALPWVRSLDLDPILIVPSGVEIVEARLTIDPRPRVAARPYAHMAIHPYPIEMVADVTLRDGARLHVRPIRPEDAELERAFVVGLSEQSRYFRFFYQLHELSPAMLARFTQIDYDREIALVAVDDADARRSIVGVARYITSVDQESAEFAVVVDDKWHGRGVGRELVQRLIAVARMRGLKRLEGAVLRNNHNMIKFTGGLGFAMHDDPDDREQVIMTLELG